MAKKRGLGRGLDALFADVAPIYVNEEKSEADNVAEAVSELAAEPGAKTESSAKTGAATNKSGQSTKQNKSSKAVRETAETGKAVGGGRIRAKDADTDVYAVQEAAANTKRSKAAAAATEADDVNDEDRVIYVDINDIKPGSAQPRMYFDETKLTELAGSIKANGVIQPLIVRKSTNGFELVAGERRWRASRIAGLSRVPCIVRDFDDRQNAIVAIIENMQREDLNPIEEAKGLKAMTEKYGFTQEQVSASLGRSRTYIANSIRLLKLPEEIQQYVSGGQMTAAHGRTIINIPDKQKQKEAAEKIIRNDLSVRATEKLADRIKDELKPERKRRKKTSDEDIAKTAEIKAVEDELRRLIGTKVSIRGEEKKGRIEIEYYSLDELNRLIDLLREAGR